MKIAIAIVIALVVLGGGWLLFANKTQAPVTNPVTGDGTSAPLETTNPNAEGDTAIAPPGDVQASVGVTTNKTVTVTYTGTTFTPNSVTIKKGDAVKFVNGSSGAMWVASAVHPTHQAYSGTTLAQHCPTTTNNAFDQCAAGATYSFTFDKVGSWTYHNHANASAHGTVVVTE
jgi:plastocyanin